MLGGKAGAYPSEASLHPVLSSVTLLFVVALNVVAPCGEIQKKERVKKTNIDISLDPFYILNRRRNVLDQQKKLLFAISALNLLLPYLQTLALLDAGKPY